MSPAPMRARTGAALAAILALALAAAPARAATLVADLSEHLVAITTGFTGARVLLFGAVEDGGDVVVVVRGPEDTAVVRRKGRVAGIWINVDEVTFRRVPSYYAVAASRPLTEILPAEIAEQEQIGAGNLALETGADRPRAEIDRFRAALVRNRERDGLYQAGLGEVRFLGDKLFRAQIAFPANVPTGAYSVTVLQVRDREIVGAFSTPLIVGKVGLSAEVYDFAHRHSIFYGLIAILAAVIAGWGATRLFRRT